MTILLGDRVTFTPTTIHIHRPGVGRAILPRDQSLTMLLKKEEDYIRCGCGVIAKPAMLEQVPDEHSLRHHSRAFLNRRYA